VQVAGQLFAFLGFSLGIVYSVVFFCTAKEGVWASQFDKYTSSVMYMTFISRKSTEVFFFNDLSFPKKALTVSFFIILNLQTFLISYIDVFCFLAALALYDITNRIDRVICSNADLLDIRFLLTYYQQLCTEVNKMNAINSRVMLVVYVQKLT